jgi:glutathione synthase/RimK-type ligase-like ATP-grasp enzyme
MRVEGYTPPAQIVAQVERIAAAVGLDVGGVEYLVDDRDGRPYFYDVNALSNFVADAERVVGLDPFARLADYLEARAYGSGGGVARADEPSARGAATAGHEALTAAGVA